MGAKDATQQTQTKLSIGENVEATIEGSTLTLKVDLSEDLGETSGGNRRIASTCGNFRLPGGESVGLNVYRKTKAKK
jgi:hypothetical protein